MAEIDDIFATYSSQVKRSVAVSCYKVRFDDTGTYVYVGIAAPGTLTTAASWSIKRITSATGDVDWINGNSSFSNVWTTRAAGAYS